MQYLGFPVDNGLSKRGDDMFSPLDLRLNYLDSNIYDIPEHDSRFRNVKSAGKSYFI